MATDGTPEVCAKRCGEAIARLRTQRRWSRAQLVIRIYSELSSDDPSYGTVSETWLARLENGRMVKVPRQTVEALCRALRCTPRERAHVLLHADRNILAEHDAEPTLAAEALTFAMDRLYVEARDLLTTFLDEQPQSTAYDELDLLEATAAALQAVIERRRRRDALRQRQHDLLPAGWLASE